MTIPPEDHTGYAAGAFVATDAFYAVPEKIASPV
jgi:hypothetical protein